MAACKANTADSQWALEAPVLPQPKGWTPHATPYGYPGYPTGLMYGGGGYGYGGPPTAQMPPYMYGHRYTDNRGSHWVWNPFTLAYDPDLAEEAAQHSLPGSSYHSGYAPSTASLENRMQNMPTGQDAQVRHPEHEHAIGQ